MYYVSEELYDSAQEKDNEINTETFIAAKCRTDQGAFGVNRGDRKFHEEPACPQHESTTVGNPTN